MDIFLLLVVDEKRGKKNRVEKALERDHLPHWGSSGISCFFFVLCFFHMNLYLTIVECWA